MPEGPSSLARDLVRPMRAALLAEYTASQEAPVIPQIELTLTIFPRCSLRNRDAACWLHRKAPLTLTPKTRSHCRGVQSVNRPVDVYKRQIQLIPGIPIIAVWHIAAIKGVKDIACKAKALGGAPVCAGEAAARRVFLLNLVQPVPNAVGALRKWVGKSIEKS